MKSALLALTILILGTTSLYAQNSISDKPRMFVSMGFVTPQFFDGTELIRAYDLRQVGQSYYQSGDGSRRDVGSYGTNAGWSVSIGYYLPIKKVRGLSVGLLVNSALTGSTPDDASDEEGYFFNFLNFGLGVQYFPFQTNNLYAKYELGMGSVWTKNRFINQENEQDFLHHFGVGFETGGGLGYMFTPFENKMLGLYLEGQYQLYSTRVEVTGIGDDQWRFGALHISAGLQF